MRKKLDTDRLPCRVRAVMGETFLPLGDLRSLGEGSVIPLDRPAGEMFVLEAGGIPVALGEPAVVNDSYAIRILKVLAAGEGI